MIDDIRNLTKKLEKLIATKLKADGVPAPPRLVRANSAFALLSALGKLESNPDFARMERAKTGQKKKRAS